MSVSVIGNVNFINQNQASNVNNIAASIHASEQNSAMLASQKALKVAEVKKPEGTREVNKDGKNGSNKDHKSKAKLNLEEKEEGIITDSSVGGMRLNSSFEVFA